MIMKHKFIVPGLEEISSDENTDDEIIFLHESDRQIDNYETISIDDSSLSEDNNDDIILVSVEDKRRHTNEVWRNIIECDLLDQGIQALGLKKFRVNRDVESYDLPSYKLRRYKRKNFCRFRNFNHKYRNRKPRREIIDLSSDGDGSSFYQNKNTKEKKTDKSHPIIIESDNNESEDSGDDSGDDHEEINQVISDSDTDSEDEEKLNTWNKLITHLNQDQFQIEFESGRETAARRISSELKEPKIDLIERCLIYLGLEKCQTFLTATKRIESSGGMPTKDGSRRRTAGGVFFTLIKSDRNIEAEVKEQIFQDNNDTVDESESLWWKSVEISQYRPRNNSRVSNATRRKEFKSYTLIDLDYFECFKEFRYRYIPMMSNFPYAVQEVSEDDEVDSDVMEIDLNHEIDSGAVTDNECFALTDHRVNEKQYVELDIFEFGHN